ncbi:MAG: hypothetical protein DRP45_00600 [Candidatus Zixiibacteriota bacterium]|nr:MAG: hypothetical protein DRP45_00600 [candidate division Zixibacteria bacterium]
MFRKKLTHVIIWWIVLLLVTVMFGDVSIAATDAGRTSADFLLIGAGARAASMGGAYATICEDATSAYWNPSGLAAVEHYEVSLGHFAWYQDITVEQATAAFPVADAFTVAAHITYVNYGTIEGYDISGVSTGELTVYDWVAGLSIGHQLDERFSVGITGKFVNQKLDSYGASAFAADVGIRYTHERFTIAAVLTNIGSKLKFDQTAEKLPSAFKFGLAARPFDAAAVTSLEFEKRLSGDLLVHQGFEFGFDDQYYLRAGYDYLPSQNGRSLATCITIGAGVRFDLAEIDYAFSPNDKSTSEDLHRFSVTFRFGQ